MWEKSTGTTQCDKNRTYTMLVLLNITMEQIWEKKTKEPLYMTKELSNVILELHNVIMKLLNIRRKKRKETTKFEKIIVKCDVGTA